MKLGKMYISKIQDEKYYEKLIMDQDITGRSALKIITLYKLSELMEENDPKAESMIIKIWRGKETVKCDGDLYEFSSIVHLLNSNCKQASGNQRGGCFDMLTNYFKSHLKVDYSF